MPTTYPVKRHKRCEVCVKHARDTCERLKDEPCGHFESIGAIYTKEPQTCQCCHKKVRYRLFHSGGKDICARRLVPDWQPRSEVNTISTFGQISETPIEGQEIGQITVKTRRGVKLNEKLNKAANMQRYLGG